MALKKTQGKAAGGHARAESMTAEQRKAASQKAVNARRAKDALPRATHIGELRLGEISIQCAVLPDGRRVLSQNSVTGAFGVVKGGNSAGGELPAFLAQKALKPFINNELEQVVVTPILYVDPRNNSEAFGFDATILPRVCNVWLQARDAGALQERQLGIATRADLLMRAFAEVGIIALVDEATGYQRDREKDALAKVLEAFVAKELQPYMRAFPADYYEHLFRLRGLKYPPENPKFRPQYFGVLTNDIVYERLAPGLLEELKRQAKKDEKKAHLHRRLTQEVGHPKLREHLSAVVMAMKLSKDYPDFIAKMNLVFPRFGETFSLDLEDVDRG